MASIEVLLPRTSDAMTEALLAQWVVGSGEAVSEGDVIAEVETEKALVEVVATADGRLVHEVGGGDVVQVGTAICTILTGQDAEDFDPSAQPQPAAQAAEPPAAEAPKPVEDVPPVAAADPAPVVSSGQPASTPTSNGTSGRTAISPIARKMAREAGIDVASLAPGSGPGGRIVRADLEHAAARPAAVASGPSTALAPRHATIARRMVESKQTIPHFYLNRAIEVDRLIELHQQVGRAEPGRKVAFTAWLIRAAWLALESRPDLTVRWTDSGVQEVTDPGVGFAVALEGVDLAVPVVRGEHLSTATATSARMAELIGRARAGRLSLDDSDGAVVTVSNLGQYGIDQLYPIVPLGQSLILGIGRTTERLHLGEDGSVTVRHVINVSLAADHRIVSGAMGATYLGEIADRLEEPLRLIS